MPIYEYSCADCGYKFDLIRNMSDADKSVVCDQCNSLKTHRLVSVFYARSQGKSLASATGCSNCSGGSCGSCNH